MYPNECAIHILAHRIYANACVVYTCPGASKFDKATAGTERMRQRVADPTHDLIDMSSRAVTCTTLAYISQSMFTFNAAFVGIWYAQTDRGCSCTLILTQPRWGTPLRACHMGVSIY
jgi:hypothetical protein